MGELRLPDFDDMIALATEIGTLKKGLLTAKGRLSILKAQITRDVSTTEEYFVKGKPPSMSYIESNYHNLGINKKTRTELVDLKASIATKEGSLREKELLFDVYRAMIDVWRTESANKRGAFFEG